MDAMTWFSELPTQAQRRLKWTTRPTRKGRRKGVRQPQQGGSYKDFIIGSGSAESGDFPWAHSPFSTR